jgi:cobalamin 5'-phosphate synthase/cobalamin synthase
MMKVLRGFALAFSMLSILPFFRVHDFYKGINGYAVMFYPFVGFLLGSLLYGMALLLEPYFSAWHIGILLLGMWVLLTGALHLDGFADTIDGLFVSKERALEVMSDPHVGAMGMIFTFVFLLLKASALAALHTWYLLPFVLMLGRLNAVVAIYALPYVKESGMGALAKEEFRLWQFCIVLLYVGIYAFFTSWALVALSLVAFLLMALLFLRRYGGMSGDMYGFVIEMSELLLLHAMLVGVTS